MHHRCWHVSMFTWSFTSERSLTEPLTWLWPPLLEVTLPARASQLPDCCVPLACGDRIDRTASESRELLQPALLRPHPSQIELWTSLIFSANRGKEAWGIVTCKQKAVRLYFEREKESASAGIIRFIFGRTYLTRWASYSAGVTQLRRSSHGGANRLIR